MNERKRVIQHMILMRPTVFSEQKNNSEKHIDGLNEILLNKSKKFGNKNSKMFEEIKTEYSTVKISNL